MGPSGSGKSTMLNILGLLDNSWTGSYLIDGADVRSLTSAERDELRSQTFGFVFQSSYVNPWDSVERNAAFALSARGVRLKEQRAEVARALRVVDMEKKSLSLARYLSGGERQRLAVARAISARPRVLLAGEPTGNLDSAATARVVELLHSLHRAGTTIILITHDVDVASHADRTVTVRDGRVEDELRSNLSREGQAKRAPRAESPRGRGVIKLLDRFARAVNNATSRPLRSLALAAAFGLAIAGLVAAAGVGASASQQIADRLAAAARDELRVAMPASVATNEDVRRSWISAIQELPAVARVGEVGTVEGSLARPSRLGLLSSTPDLTAATITASKAFLEMTGAKVAPAPAVHDFAEGQRVAFVGTRIAESLGVVSESFGHEIWVADRPYTVLGVIDSGGREESLTRAIVIPLQDEFVSSRQLLIHTEAGYPAAVADAIPLAISPSSPGSVEVSTVGDLRNLRVGVSTDLQGLLLSLSWALLGFAVLSVSAAMFLAVQARLQELALSRALGLSPWGVGLVFVFEGALLGLAGAFIGVAGGLAVAVAVAASRGWSAVVPWETLAMAPAIGLLAGAVSAAVPALRASRVDPADAIR